MSVSAARALDALSLTPRRTGVFSDFDGTLAAIVTEHDEAAPVAGVADALQRLSTRLGAVAVISGRPLAFLERHFPERAGSRVVLAGLYGLERSGPSAGGLDEEEARHWRERLSSARALLETALPSGVGLEDKGLSLVLHWRAAPTSGDAAFDLGRDIGGRLGLELRPGRLALELIAPFPIDKGTVVGELATGLDVACYLGDDSGDLSAFRALSARERDEPSSFRALRIAIDSDEAPSDLLEEADVVLESPHAVGAFLEALAQRVT